MIRVFKRIGGVHAPHRKHTAECATVPMPTPKTIVLPMLQHIGALCTPVVKVGDTVAVGQMVADSDAPVSVPIHSSVSGTVTAMKDLLLPGGRSIPSLVIEADGEQRLYEGIKPPVIETFEEFIAAVRASGLVGLGGAGFPQHVKLNPKNLDEVETLIINAAECEPYITADYRECMEHGEDVMEGIQLVMKYLDIRHTVIGIERNKPAAIAHLSKLASAISTKKRRITIKTLAASYPQGAEKVLIDACIGREVPIGKLPADVGCVVMNVTSVAFLARYMKTGMPLVERRVTVDGSAVENPQNLRVAIGTPVCDILNFTGLKKPVSKLLYGGPMMGLALMNDELPLLKQNNAILALAQEDVLDHEATPCIRCGRCVDVCPMRLMPTAITKAYKTGNVEELNALNTMTCMECGSCTFACPAHRPIIQTIRMAKSLMRNTK